MQMTNGIENYHIVARNVFNLQLLPIIITRYYLLY